MKAARDALEDGVLAHHVHLLRLIQRSLLDDNGDIETVQREIGKLYHVTGLAMIDKVTGSHPTTMQAATLGELRAALGLVVEAVEQTGYHPHDWYPAGWRESLEWAKNQLLRLRHSQHNHEEAVMSKSTTSAPVLGLDGDGCVQS